MEKKFGGSVAWLTGFVFLSVMVFAGPGFANESGQENGDSAQRVNEHLAEGDRIRNASDEGRERPDGMFESIFSVGWAVTYDSSKRRSVVTARVGITVTEYAEGTEYLTLWADWNRDGIFEKDPGPGQEPEEMMTVSLEAGSIREGEPEILSAETPEGYAADEVQVRISLAYELTSVWKDVWDGTVSCLNYFHSADTSRDYKIDISEFLRVQQLYNNGPYHCVSDPDSEDGYGPGSKDRECIPHNSDYDPQD